MGGREPQSPVDMVFTHASLSALAFIAAGIALAAIMMAMRRDLRRPLAIMIALTLVGEVGLVLMQSLQPPSGGRAWIVGTELLLFVITLGFARIVLMFLFQVILVGMAVPRILVDLIMAVALIVYLLVRISAAGVDLAAIAIPSTVITAALALSLRETLGNLWGGISLQLDNTCRIGDWVRVDNIFGQIVGIRWRYMAIATNSGETVIVPNSQLVQNKVNVLGRRGDLRVPCRRDVAFQVTFASAPSRVIAVVQDAVQRIDTENVSPTPAPTCICTDFADSGIQYKVVYWIIDLARDRWTDSRIRAHIYAALARAGMEFAFPHQVLLRGKHETGDQAFQREQRARLETLAHVPLFAAFTESERQALAADLVTCHFVLNDVISRLGERADCLYILSSGTVNIFGEGGDRATRPRLGELTGPDYFGEMGLLTGQARTASVIAADDVVCYRLDKDGFDAILQARPALIDVLSQVVTTRQAANYKALELSAEARARQASNHAAELVRRIREFFDLR